MEESGAATIKQINPAGRWKAKQADGEIICLLPHRPLVAGELPEDTSYIWDVSFISIKMIRKVLQVRLPTQQILICAKLP